MEVGLSVFSINRAGLWKHESEVNFRLSFEGCEGAVGRSASQTSETSREDFARWQYAEFGGRTICTARGLSRKIKMFGGESHIAERQRPDGAIV
jgi:hypothetical protein